jgi:carboxymethylenebutenolidase
MPPELTPPPHGKIETHMADKPSPATLWSSGFAAAVQPIRAETIHTDSEGLEAGGVTIPVADGEIPGYRAMPVRGGNFPVVLVIQEIFGVHEHIKDVCRRLAKRGYFAIAPELYVRQGDVSGLQDNKEIYAKVVSKVPDAQVMSDLDATAAYAASTGKCDMSRLVVTGFCWGGRAAWLYAAHNPQLRAAVAWYGRLLGDIDDLKPKRAVDVVADLKCPVLGLYGGRDESIPMSHIDQIRQAIRLADKNCEIVVYPEAGHAFYADYRPSYDKNAAEDGWRRLQLWFKQYAA